MERSPDLGVLLKNLEKKHKLKPVQFVSVAGGIQKRLETNLKGRRSTRLSLFDRIRNLPRCESPGPSQNLAPLSEAQQKVERRRQQLEKWKEEKEKRKKEQALQKKKPFVAGVPHNPLKFVPPPPVKAAPSTSGRVTRSQAARTVLKQKVDPKPAKASQSFAPKNASFRPPEIKNITKVPKLAPVPKTREPKTYNFDFSIVPNNVPKPSEYNSKVTKQTRSKTTKPTETTKPVETRMTRRNAKELEKTTKSRVTKKPSPKKMKNVLSGSSSSDMETVSRKQSPNMTKTTKNFFSSSSSDMETTVDKSIKNLHSGSSQSDMEVNEKPKNPKVSKKTVLASSSSDTEKSPILRSRTPLKVRQTYVITPKNPVPKSESSSEERLRSPKSPGGTIDLTDSVETPQQVTEDSKRISPCVTMSRGKANARKEMKQKLADGLLDEDNSEAESVEHFRRQLASEVARLTELCDTWDKIREQTVLAETVQDEVLGAVGQGRLLVSSKLQQFAGLVERCAKPEPGSPLITPADLHGFWDMVFMQIENVDMRFKRLEQRRARGWADELLSAPTRKVARLPAKKQTKPAAAPSKLREMIAAARKAKKEQEEQTATPPEIVQPADSKTFEAGFFCVRSPVRSPAPATPNNKHNLLKAVLSSEAKKASASRNSSSFAMLRASIMSRNLEAEGIAPLPQTPLNPINLTATPGRSILKSASDNTKSGKKSIKIVLFDDSDTDAQPSPLKPEHPDSGVSSMDIEKSSDNKENPKRKTRLVRQDAVVNDETGVKTRSRRKSGQMPVDEEKSPKIEKNRRTSRRKTLQETDVNMQDVATPKRSLRSRKSNVAVVDHVAKDETGINTISYLKSAEMPIVEEKSSKIEKNRRNRRKTLQETDVNMQDVATPKRSLRSRKSNVAVVDNVVNETGVNTLSQLKNDETPIVEEKSPKIEKNRRSSIRQTLQETDVNMQDVATPKRSLRSRKKNVAVVG